MMLSKNEGKLIKYDKRYRKFEGNRVRIVKMFTKFASSSLYIV